MTGESDEDGAGRGTEGAGPSTTRRTFLGATGTAAVAGTGLLGAGTAAAAEEIDPTLLNWRRVEAAKVWTRGYRGRADRTLALTDSGVSSAHPELGPWNGVNIEKSGDGINLRTVTETTKELPVLESEVVKSVGPFRGRAGGTGAVGLVTRTETFTLTDAEAKKALGDEKSFEGHEIDATLTWNQDTPGPQAASVEMTLQRHVDSDGDGTNDSWKAVDSAGPSGLTFSSGNRAELSPQVEAGTYRFKVTVWRGVAQWRIDVTHEALTPKIENGVMQTETRTVDEFDEFDGDPVPDRDSTGADTPKTIGWYNPEPRYGDEPRPTDTNGHGSHVSGIMAGSGRGSTLDLSGTEVHEPRAILLPGDFIEYEVDVPAEGSIFASALGDNVVVEIVNPAGIVIHESPLRGDSIIADEPPVHRTGRAKYTVRVRPAETNAATDAAASRAQSGNPLVGRLEKIAVGNYVAPGGTAGERDEGGDPAVHPGVGPDFSIVGLQGLGTPTADLTTMADDLADTFNVRAVNMSWGPILGLPVGMLGGVRADAKTILSAIKATSEAGVLVVAAAGNSFTPANGNGYPAVAEEAISVVATGPLDGITSYSSGGLGGIDEDSNEFNAKPDVTAPGGDVEPDAAGVIALAVGSGPLPANVQYPFPSKYELVRSVKSAETDDGPYHAGPPRDYTSFGGTSMASPYVNGVAGLVAQAMEEDAPESLSLPVPADTTYDDVMRLKGVLLATASETAFTAAPYHTAKTVPSTPTYEFGDRDPYEGYGRVNPDTAVDAVTVDLLPKADTVGKDETTTESHAGVVGLNLPVDSRAVAGYVHTRNGTLEASVDVTHLAGGNRGMAKGSPHVDLFVYDAENPTDNGEPNIVARAQGRQGSASVSADLPHSQNDEKNDRMFLVVAKLVNVPGVVNGYDVQAHLDLTVTFTGGPDPAPTTTFSAGGSRSDDGSAFTGGQTNTINVTLSNLTKVDGATVVDDIPAEWDVLTEFSENVSESDIEETDDGRKHVTLSEGDVQRTAVDGTEESASFTYLVEAPQSAAESMAYTFGPARAETDDEETSSGVKIENDVATFGGTETNVVAGTSTNEPDGSGSSTDGTTETTDGTADGTTDTTDGTTDTTVDTDGTL